MKKFVIFTAALMSGIMASAEKVDVKTFQYAGPFEVKKPVLMDSVDVNKKAFEVKQLLDSGTDLKSLIKGGSTFEGTFAPVSKTGDAVHTLSFSIINSSFAKAKVVVKGLKEYKTYIDGKESHGESSLEPASHDVVIKYFTTADERMDSLKVSVEGDKFVVNGGAQSAGMGRPWTIYDVLLGERYSSIDISPNGKYVIFSKSNTVVGGNTSYIYYVKDVASGRIVDTRNERIQWMPRTNKYYYKKRGKLTGAEKEPRTQLVAVDPATRQETVIAPMVPNESFEMSPTEDFLIVTTYKQGPKENPDVYEVVSPEDRQPGYRTRSNLAKFDLKTGVMQPLTYGYHNMNLCDISQDGKYILMMKSEERLTQRPTTLFTIYRLNLETMNLETVVDRDGFVGNALFTADGKNVIVQGSPECLDGVGKAVKEGQTPSMIDNQLYLLSEGTGGKWNAKPLTKQFNPCVQGMQLSPSDGMVYFTAENKDCVHLYQLNPKNGKILQVKEPEDIVSSISVSSASGQIAMYGQGANNSDRMYLLNAKSQKSVLIDDISSEKLKGVKLGECKAWTYVNESGDSICCRYYLPADFDSSKKYPMIVNYYGGCSPTGRNFESRYPHHAYAALGYVVLIVNPHGATGFGQEWSAAHVNTAGQGPAEDIIGATKTFCKEHAWVNDKKIGCIGASYGGFMTQYLQTVTDIFAAAISHAGISDHTSYWGYGYWGYSYSEVSMANSYPWTRKDLFVDQSPLYNADKVHTPLLFVHGDGDTNVPVNESIQMYTALKLLGRETSMVLVKGQNHHILDYEKRLKWQNTIWAWFAKWLQDDSTWWDSMYGKGAF